MASRECGIPPRWSCQFVVGQYGGPISGRWKVRGGHLRTSDAMAKGEPRELRSGRKGADLPDRLIGPAGQAVAPRDPRAIVEDG